MKMFGHQNPADEQEIQLLPHLLKPLDKAAPKAIREEKWRAAIGAGGDEWEFTGTVYAVVNCDSDSKKPGWAADQRSVCQQVYPIRPHGS